MALIATAGSNVANAYCTAPRAHELLLPTLRETVLTDASIVALEDALIWATRLINDLVVWHWPPATTTQALPWPVSGAVDKLGRVLSSTAIPAFLELATAEYALALFLEYVHLRAKAAATADMLGLKVLAIDDVRIEAVVDSYAPHPSMAELAAVQRMPVTVRRLLAPYGEVAGSGTVRLLRT